LNIKTHPEASTETKLTPKQHSALGSLLLHLVPGVFILVGIFVFSQPFFVNLFGIEERLAPLLGYLMALLFGLIPVQVGILLYVGNKQFGKTGMKGVIGYLNRSPIKHYLIIIPILLAYNILLFVVLAPLIQPFIVKALFSWYPERYNFQLYMQGVMQDPSSISAYRGIYVLLSLYILLSCILGPLVEELYFRGFLLPRMQKYAKKWAPLINSVLFSLYHFFSPWENLIRIVGIFPMVYVVWRKKDIRFGILTHIILNTFGGIAMLVALQL
jgi:membrane protease YdiL (CAAX protease family)